MKNKKGWDGYPVPRIVIESKEPGRTPTCWVVLHYLVGDLRLLDDAERAFAAEGWRREPNGVPPIEGQIEMTFVKDGTAIFRGWTPAEYRRNIASVDRVVEKLGVPSYRRRLTLADML